MKQINEGDVVIAGTGQAGTFIGQNSTHVCVLLRNGELWFGHSGLMRHPQSQEDLDAAPIEVDKFKDR